MTQKGKTESVLGCVWPGAITADQNQGYHQVTVVVKRELSRKEKLSVYWSIFVHAEVVHLVRMPPGCLPLEVFRVR